MLASGSQIGLLCCDPRLRIFASDHKNPHYEEVFHARKYMSHFDFEAAHFFEDHSLGSDYFSTLGQFLLPDLILPGMSFSHWLRTDLL